MGRMSGKSLMVGVCSVRDVWRANKNCEWRATREFVKTANLEADAWMLPAVYFSRDRSHKICSLDTDSDLQR